LSRVAVIVNSFSGTFVSLLHNSLIKRVFNDISCVLLPDIYWKRHVWISKVTNTCAGVVATFAWPKFIVAVAVGMFVGVV